MSVWSGGNQDYLSSKITITSTRATILDGYVESDLHLPQEMNIFNLNVVVTNNSILTIDQVLL